MKFDQAFVDRMKAAGCPPELIARILIGQEREDAIKKLNEKWQWTGNAGLFTHSCILKGPATEPEVRALQAARSVIKEAFVLGFTQQDPTANWSEGGWRISVQLEDTDKDGNPIQVKKSTLFNAGTPDPEIGKFLQYSQLEMFQPYPLNPRFEKDGTKVDGIVSDDEFCLMCWDIDRSRSYIPSYLTADDIKEQKSALRELALVKRREKIADKGQERRMKALDVAEKFYVEDEAGFEAMVAEELTNLNIDVTKVDVTSLI